MPAPDDTHEPNHPPSADDHAQQKRDLWAAAKAAAIARGSYVPPAAPALASPPAPPPKKRKIKLRTPLVAARAPVEVVADEEGDEPPPPVDEQLVIEPVAAHKAAAAVEEPLPIAPKASEGATPIDDGREPRVIASPAAKHEKIPDNHSDQPAATDFKSNSQDQPADDKKNDGKEKLEDKKKTADGKDAIPLTDEEQRAAMWKARRAKVLKLWLTIGGGSLGVSLGVHLLLLIIAMLLYVTYNREERIDFLPGGGTQQGADASQALENKVTRKKNQWLTKKVPMQKVAVQNAMSQIQLPNQDLDIQLPMTKDFMTAGKMGGGFGNGSGLGAKGGMTFKPITLFGREIIGKKLAVILDVSYSMTPYLSAVVKEVDRVAKGSPVILYYGCGIERLKPGVKLNESVYRTQQLRAFEGYWRLLRDDPSKPAKQIPNGDVFSSFARRDNTFYVDNHEVEYSWTALLNDVIRSADALYWFSDFDDPVNERQMAIVKENLDNRKQRLYIHPQKRGFSFEKVRDVLAIPTGGDVIEPKEKN